MRYQSLARDVPAFVMCCIHGESCSSLLIESTDSVIRMPGRLPGLSGSCYDV